MTRTELVEMIKGSGLLGRGGAAFSAGLKWSFLAPARPAYLVVNGDESEPGTFKDRQLLERDPHQMVEGIIIAADRQRGSPCVHLHPGRVSEAGPAGSEGGRRGLCQGLPRKGHLRELLRPRGDGPPRRRCLHLRRGDGSDQLPRGSAGRAQAQAPLLPGRSRSLQQADDRQQRRDPLQPALHPRARGSTTTRPSVTPADTGTFLFSVSGHVRKPGNYELPHGLTWRELIYDVAGGIRDDRQLKTWIPGGASAPWFVPADHLDLPVTKDDTAKAGSMLGSGAVVIMDDTTCVVRAAERIVRFFAHESCGQCTPCREGTTWLEMILRRIESGQGRVVDADLLLDVSDNISVGLAWPPKMTTICPLGPSAVSPIISISKYFKDEVMAHIHEGRCPLRRAQVASQCARSCSWLSPSRSPSTATDR